MLSRLAACFAAVLVSVQSGATGTLPQEPASHVVFKDASKLTWTEQAPGATVAVLWGDMDKGPYGALTRFKAGSWFERHVHPSDIHLVVIEGVYVHRPDDGPEVRVTPGSYLFLPGGTPHVSGSDADTLFLHSSDGHFGLVFQPKVSATSK
jgi:quercetin dioxygenase-like cupin family protein